MFKLRIKMSSLIIPLIFYITDNFKMFIIVFCAALVHEAAHIIFIKICGNNIEKVELMAFGINIVKKGYLGFKDDIIIALSGPLVNLFLCFFSYFVWQSFLPLDEIYCFSGINLFLFFINMLPVLPLDGGRALYSFFMLKFEVLFAQNLFFWVSVCFSVALFFAGCMIFLQTGYNLSVIVISLFLVFNVTQYNNLYNC